MTASELELLGGAALSLIFGLVPGISDWYNALDKVRKLDVMIAAILILSLGLFGLSCAGYLNVLFPSVDIPCTVPGGLKLLEAIILVAISNQGTFQLFTKRFRKVR